MFTGLYFVILITNFFTALDIYLCMSLVIITIIAVFGPIMFTSFFNSADIAFLTLCNLCTKKVVINFLLLCRFFCR